MKNKVTKSAKDILTEAMNGSDEMINYESIERPNKELDELVDAAICKAVSKAARVIGYRPDEDNAVAYIYQSGIDVMVMDVDEERCLHLESVSTGSLDYMRAREGEPVYSGAGFLKSIAKHPSRFTEVKDNGDGSYELTSNRGKTFSYTPSTGKLTWHTKSGISENTIPPRGFSRYFTHLDQPAPIYVKKERVKRPKKEKLAPPKKTHEQTAMQRTKFFTDKISDPECQRLDIHIDEQTMAITVTATGTDGRTATMRHTYEELDTRHQDWTKAAWTLLKENKNPITYERH